MTTTNKQKKGKSKAESPRKKLEADESDDSESETHLESERTLKGTKKKKKSKKAPTDVPTLEEVAAAAEVLNGFNVTILAALLDAILADVDGSFEQIIQSGVTNTVYDAKITTLTNILNIIEAADLGLSILDEATAAVQIALAREDLELLRNVATPKWKTEITEQMGFFPPP